jgi:RND family efflux transporter MFP subunit
MMRVHPFLYVAIVVVLGGCQRQASPPTAKAEPAHVAQHVEESSLNTVTLTPQAEQRLGIQIVEAQQVAVRRKRTVGGEVLIPPGQTVVVSAPLPGELALAGGAPLPAPGTTVTAGQTLFAFQPLLSPEREVLTPAERVRVAQTRADVATVQMEAERLIESAKISRDAARIAYDRAVALLKAKAASQRVVDDAEAQFKLAQEALITAQTRHRLLSGIELDEQAGELQARSITSPVAGVLQSLDAAVGESVTAGEPLFTVIMTDRLWLRVPVYVGHWRQVDTTASAQFTEYGDASHQPPLDATYVTAPPSANALANTIDLFYEISNEQGHWRPGQKVAVTLPLGGEEESLIVPRNATLYDTQGGTWVYRRLKEHTFARQRVAVRYIDGDNAVLDAGAEPGMQVVTDGAVELFGTEFGVGH